MADSPAPPAHPGPLEDALVDDDNVLVPLRYPELRKQFLDSIEAQKADIEAMIRSDGLLLVSLVRLRDMAFGEL